MQHLSSVLQQSFPDGTLNHLSATLGSTTRFNHHCIYLPPESSNCWKHYMHFSGFFEVGVQVFCHFSSGQLFDIQFHLCRSYSTFGHISNRYFDEEHCILFSISWVSTISQLEKSCSSFEVFILVRERHLHHLWITAFLLVVQYFSLTKPILISLNGATTMFYNEIRWNQLCILVPCNA